MPNNYCTITELTDALADGNAAHVSYETILTALITRASRAIDTFTRREPGAYSQSATDTETRYYDGSGGWQQWTDEMVATPTTVAVSESGGLASTDYTTYPSTDWFVWPYNAADFGQPYQRIDLDTINGAYSTFYTFPKSIQVVSSFGYADTDNTPGDIVYATIVQAARWFKRGQQGFQDSGGIAELGQLRFTQRLDPEVKEIIDHFRRVAV